MIERLLDMPPGVVGFRAFGEVSAEDYRDVLEPALREAADTGEIRLLYVVDGDLDMTSGAIVQDAKVGLGLGVGHHSAWRRSAVVTDVDWVRKALGVFAWVVPGELKLFGASELEEAKRWVSATN